MTKVVKRSVNKHFATVKTSLFITSSSVSSEVRQFYSSFNVCEVAISCSEIQVGDVQVEDLQAAQLGYSLCFPQIEQLCALDFPQIYITKSFSLQFLHIFVQVTAFYLN